MTVTWTASVLTSAIRRVLGPERKTGRKRASSPRDTFPPPALYLGDGQTALGGRDGGHRPPWGLVPGSAPRPSEARGVHRGFWAQVPQLESWGAMAWGGDGLMGWGAAAAVECLAL